MTKVECTNCKWQGEETALKLQRDDSGDFDNACPNCLTDSYLMDDETKYDDRRMEEVAKQVAQGFTSGAYEGWWWKLTINEL